MVGLVKRYSELLRGNVNRVGELGGRDSPLWVGRLMVVGLGVCAVLTMGCFIEVRCSGLQILL